MRLIQVADNGSGIEAEYIPTAFIRHATSKIATERDLEAFIRWAFGARPGLDRQRGTGGGAHPHRAGRICLLLPH